MDAIALIRESWHEQDPDPMAVVLAAATGANVREINCGPETGMWMIPIPVQDVLGRDVG